MGRAGVLLDHDVDVVETHSSKVFLAGAFAYKVKKPVKLPFADYATPTKRRAAILRELKVNQFLYPRIYLCAESISWRSPPADASSPSELALKMVRLESDRFLDGLIHDGLFTREDSSRIAEAVHAYHQRCPQPPQRRCRAARVMTERAAHASVEASRRWLSAHQVARLHRAERELFRTIGALMDDRAITGRVIDGHGDLHLANVWTKGFEVIFFDRLELGNGYRQRDVAAEIAFLTMDLRVHDRAEEADALLDTYANLTADPDLPALARRFERQRACTRGWVMGLRGDDVRAKRYYRFALARA